MEGLNLSNGLKFKLGDETVAKLAALKELDNKTAMLFAQPENLTNEMMISISRKTVSLTKFLKELNKIKAKHISNDKKAEQIKAAMTQLLGNDAEKLSAEIEAEITATKTILEEKAKEIATHVNEETKVIAESAEKRITEDIDLLKQEKQGLFEERAQLTKQIEEVDVRYNKALTVYKEKRSFFSNFREARNEVDQETGKKKGFFASIKAALTTTKDSRVQEVDFKRKEELGKIADERIRIENAIAEIDKKIVALSEQKKNVNKDILKEHSLVAEAIKAHLDKAKNLKVEFNEKQVTLNEKEAELAKLSAKERVDGQSEELTAAIEEVKAEIEQLREGMVNTHADVMNAKRSGQPTVENQLAEADKLIAELSEKAEKTESYTERMKIEKQIYDIEEQQRDAMAPIVDAEYEAIYGRTFGEDKKEEEKEASNESEKKVITQEEFESNKDGWIHYLELRLEDLRASVQSATIEERKKIIPEIEWLDKKKETYKTATSQEEMEEMREEFRKQEEAAKQAAMPKRRRRQNIEQER